MAKATCPEYPVSLVWKGDREVKPRAMHIPCGKYITAEESPGKPQLMHSFKAVRPLIVFSGIPSLQISLEVSHCKVNERQQQQQQKINMGLVLLLK